MLSIAHGPTGAFLASKIPNPLISIPLIIASHFLEDRVPHWDVGTGLTNKTKSKRESFLQELLIDLPLSFLIVFLLFQMGRPFDWRPWLGWFVGLLPDFIEFPYLFMHNRHPLMIKFAVFHAWIHRSTPSKFWGLAPQFLVLAVILLWK